MIEFFVVVTLFTIGYLMNKANPALSQTNQGTRKKPVMPSMNNIYQSNHIAQCDNVLKKKADTMFQQSQEPDDSGVVSRNYKLNSEGANANKKIRLLSGEEVDPARFNHNNMVPYFGGKMTQNTDQNIINTKIENFTGSFSHYKKKEEVESFFDQSKDISNPYGMQNMNDFYMDRMVAPKAQNNVTPVPKINVGPGINKGYTADPTGGFHQADYRGCVMPKSVDELRIASNPKTSYEARQLDGQKGSLPGKIGAVAKNRIETVFEMNEDNYFKTTGSRLKETLHPCIQDKETNRQHTTKEYIGGVLYQQSKAPQAETYIRPSDRHVLDPFGIRNPSLATKGTGAKDDYGKSTITVFANERDLTSTKVYQGNLTSLIKAIVAPIQDMIKVTRKEDAIDNPRHFGNVAPQFPDKATIYDPNDVARTTIKETTVHEQPLGNLKGNEKQTVYDPNDVARTTIKETTLQENPLGNLKGNEKLTVYDPNDIARTTIKETTLHDGMGTGTVTGSKQLYIYDPDEVAKKTLRETLDRMDYEMNMSAQVYKGQVYNPDEKARTTFREMTETKGQNGNIGVRERTGAYKSEGYNAKNTQKQFLSDMDYYGVAERANQDGYKISTIDAPLTQKQFLSDIEYYGQAQASSDKKPTSLEYIENADIRAVKESTLFGRDPTEQGSKVSLGADCLNVKFKTKVCDALTERSAQNFERVRNSIATLQDQSLTKEKKNYDQITQARLDPSILKPFLDNPYTKPLDSVA